MDKLMKVALSKVGYYYDVNTDTLYVSSVFNKKRLNYGSNEYNIVRNFREISSDLTIEIVKRAPKKKPLSYNMMEKFITILPTAEEDQKEMERQKKLSLAYKSPYKYMELWFNEKYPFHKELLVEENEESKWDVVALMRKAEALKKEKKAQKAEATAQNNISNFPTPEVADSASKDVVESA